MSLIAAGVDVGGRRKGFHAAKVGDARLVAGPVHLGDPGRVVAWLVGEPRPWLVGVDAPRTLAPAGATMRDDERAFLAARICALRATPGAAALARQRAGAAPTYYEWIERGLALHDALARAGLDAIECFPTAAWVRWGGARGQATRAAWSARTLRGLRLAGLPGRLGQDGRDAIAAAVTAWEHGRGHTERFGEIVIPRRCRHRGA